MKVGVLSPGYPPVVGGVETVVSAVCQGLVERGVEVEVWTHARGARDVPARGRADVERGVVVRRFRHTASDRFSISPGIWRDVRELAGRVDVLHAHSYHATAAPALLRVPRSVPVVFTPHFHGDGHTPLARLLHRPYRLVGRRLFARAGAVIAVSDAEREIIARSFPAALPRCEVIHNAVDVAEIHSAAPFPDTPPTLLVLGRLERYKRIDAVIEAFLRSAAPGQLVVIGDGADRPRLEAMLAGRSRADDVRLLGFLDRAEVVRWLRTARGVLSMSEHEAFGIVALEAAAAGAGVVISDLPAHREVQQLLPAGLVRISAPGEALVAELTRLLGRPNAGPRPVRDWSVVVEEHLRLYSQLVGTGASVTASWPIQQC